MKKFLQITHHQMLPNNSLKCTEKFRVEIYSNKHEIDIF